jgi:hypothetical protein
MDALTLLGLAGSVSLLAGWRMYLCVFATGLAMHFHWIALPINLASLSVLQNWWVIGASGLGLVAEFFADKIPWLDSFWDAVHTAIRPVGGALLSLAIVDPKDPTYQVAALLLGGTAALASHTAKASTRAVANVSPEPVSNIVLSTGEDVTTAGLMALVLAHPALGWVVAIAVLAMSMFVLYWARKALKKLAALRDHISQKVSDALT